jgi:replicative DNA helicase
MTDENIKLKYSESFQLQLIAELVRNKDFAVITAPNLKPAYFENTVFKILLQVINIYLEKYKDVPPDKYAFLDHFKDIKNIRVDENDAAKLAKLIEVIYAKQNGEWAFKPNTPLIRDKINDFLKMAAMKNALWGAITKLEQESYEDIRSLILAALSVGVSDTGVRFFDDIDGILERFTESRQPYTRVPTPIDNLNIKTHGGSGKGELFVILAPPNKGKSLMMGCMAANAILHNYRTIYYTLEMSADKIAWRLVQSVGQFTQDDMISRPKDVSAKIKRIKHHLSMGHIPTAYGVDDSHSQRDLIIKHYTAKSCSINTIYSHLSLLEAQGFIPDIIFVDYADLMVSTKTYTEKRAELSHIYLSLRDLAVERNINVVTASQANRSALSEEVVTMAHIAEDFGKVAIADIIVSLAQTATEKREGKMRFFIAKNRDGEAEDIITTQVNYTTMTIGDINGPIELQNELLADHRNGKLHLLTNSS